MGILQLVGGLLGRDDFGKLPKDGIHDFTPNCARYRLTSYKPLGDHARAFLTGVGMGIVDGDTIVCHPGLTVRRVIRCKVEKIRYVDADWCAYVRMVAK